MEQKKWWASKTLWLAALQGLAGVIVVLSTELPTLGWVAVAKSVVDVALRLVTDKPVA